jgi:hypothetical protein
MNPAPVRTAVVRAALAVGSFAFAVSAHAQVLYGSITGTITDATGARLAGAAVTVTHLDTTASRDAITNEAGGYTFVAVPPGRYDVKVRLHGFKEYVKADVPVTVNAISRVDVTLEIGAIAETVTVVSESTLLQADRADIHRDLKSTELVNAPLANYRNYQSLLSTIPGATPAAFQNAIIDTPARALTTNINGTARNNNNVRQDGTANTFIWLPHHALYIAPAETIDTVSITTNAFDAEQGMAGGAAVTVITKSGTNRFKGSAFAFHDNSRFRGRNFFQPKDQKVPEGSRNIDGGTLGGPIVHDRLFFFGSYEGQLERAGRIGNYTVPTDALRRGDFTALSTLIFDPATGNPDGSGRRPFPGNIIPADRISPIARRMLDLIPGPNRPGLTQNFFTSGVQQFDRHQVDAKVNWNRVPDHQIWAKYGHMDAFVHCDFPFGQGGGIPGLCDTGVGDGDTAVKIGTVGHTWAVGRHVSLDGTFGMTDFAQTVTTEDMGRNFGLEVLQIPGTNGSDPRYGGMPSFAITGFAPLGNALTWVPIYRNERSYTANTNVSWLKNTHDLRFGVDVVRYELNHWQPEIGGGPRGHFIFGGGVTAPRGGRAPDAYNSLAAFLLGLPTEMQKSLQHEVMTGREWQYALYFRDRWAVSKKLTLSLGARVERYPLMTRADRGIELVDLETLEVRLGGLGGNPKNLGIEVKYPAVLPRLGVVYRLNDPTVVRAGYGLTVDPMPFSRPLRGFHPLMIAQNFASLHPFTWARPIEQGIPDFKGPDLSSGVVALPPAVFMRTPPPDDIERGWIHSWNLVVERRLPLNFITSVGYVATATREQLADLDVNAAGAGEGRPGQPYFPQFGRTQALGLWDGRVEANYHSLQVSFNRPFVNGVLMRSSYTFSKTMNESDDSGFAGLLWNHSSQVHRNYARAGFDRPHIFHVSAVADLPFGRNGDGGAFSRLIRDWRVNGVLSLFSGTPFTVTAAGASVNAPGNLQTADQTGPAKRTGEIVPGKPYYDPSAWKPITAVRFGDSGRNSVRGPGHKNVNFSVFRSFPIRPQAKLQARIEISNLFNAPAFQNPVPSIDRSDFMQIISSSQTSDRQIRFGLRFEF